VKEAALLEVRGGREPFVSRAGRKLAAALDHFAVDPAGLVCLDVGASTGGFTDCLLQRGALRVYAIDVGYGQLDARLRADPRVVVMERTNARFLPPGALAERPALAVVDVSFISLLKVVPALLPLLARAGSLVDAGQAAVRGRPQSGRQGRHRPRRGRAARGDRCAGFRAAGARSRAVGSDRLSGARDGRQSRSAGAL
jgi:23S rRNA (cytidine1920-2'-O)/16S rRNA (cytidine1409-2'-O)-methyltransferase